MMALVIVDVQNDFCPGGALAVRDGDMVVSVINRIRERFDLVAATQDWHPSNHGSFASNHPGRKVFDVIDLHGLQQVLWPIHCIKNTFGAEFHGGLDVRDTDRVIQKGTDPTVDSYSGFFDNGKKRATGLGDWLKSKNVTEVFVCGLATDYCVKFTALDAKALGLQVTVLEDACRGVELKAGDVAAALAEMERNGIIVTTSDLFMVSSEP